MDAGSGRGKAVAEMNVTPMIDVLLVLLIIFLVIQPTVPNGLNSQIPRPSKPDAATPPNTVVVEVLASANGEPIYRINQTAFPRARIVGELKTIFAARSDRTIFVKGDADLDYGKVAEVIDMGHQADTDNIGIIAPHDAAGQ